MSGHLGKLGTAFILLFGLVACEPPRTTVNVISDKFSAGVTLEGIPLEKDILQNRIVWMLRSFVFPQTRNAEHQIYVDWFFPGHGTTRYFAADDTARSLRVKQILKESCGRDCGQTDTLGIDIDEPTLRARAATGFQVKLWDVAGNAVILDITTAMIVAQLQAEDRILIGQASPVPLPGAPGSNGAAPSAARAVNASGQPFLGIAPFDLPFGVGVMVTRVDPNTSAEHAGFQVGDIVVSYNGYAVTGADQLRGLIVQTTAGTLVRIEVKRHGQPMTLTAQM
jgi:PDZ domain